MNSIACNFKESLTDLDDEYDDGGTIPYEDNVEEFADGGEIAPPGYHFMPDGTPMTGKSHGEGSDVPLIQIKSSLPLSTPLPSTPSSPTAPTPSPTTPSYSPPSTGGGGGGY